MSIALRIIGIIDKDHYRMSDKLIYHIDLCCHGDTAAFEYIVAQYQQLVYTLAFRLLCDQDDAKDATQEAFIKVWLNISKYNQKYKFSTWIYKIASNICYDKLRLTRNVVKVNLVDCDFRSTEDQYHDINNRELKEIIMAATEGLTPKQKLVFTLIELEELSVEEVLAITGLSPAKIKSNLYLARKYIKLKIRSYE